MIEIPIGWLVSLCIMAFIGIIFSLFIIYFSLIEPLKDMITNYKKYKGYSDTHYYTNGLLQEDLLKRWLYD